LETEHLVQVANPTQYKAEVKGWLRTNVMDLGASFSVPNAVHAIQSAISTPNDATTLSNHLRRCFNRLDRLVFRQAHKRKGVRVPRIVSLEHSENVGWHAHAVFGTPEHLTTEDLSTMLKALWFDQFHGYVSPRFAKELFWAEPITGDYFGYSMKLVGVYGALDVANIVLRPQ
jgi:hypothetical protein